MMMIDVVIWEIYNIYRYLVGKLQQVIKISNQVIISLQLIITSGYDIMTTEMK